MKMLILFGALIAGFALNTPDFNAIGKLMQAGNAEALGQHLDQRIELALPGFDDLVNRDQAIRNLNRFFGQHTPSGFEIVHTGTAQSNGAHYCIGNLRTSTGTYRVYIYTRRTGQSDKIQELRIEKD